MKDMIMTSTLRTLAYAVFFAALFAVPARAEEVNAGDLVITQAWSRATPGGAKIAGAYLTIENRGSTPDRLVGGSGNVAAKVEVHEMAMKNGVMTMRSLEKGLAIEPGKTVKLAPGGYHLMLFDLKNPLKQGVSPVAEKKGTPCRPTPWETPGQTCPAKAKTVAGSVLPCNGLVSPVVS